MPGAVVWNTSTNITLTLPASGGSSTATLVTVPSGLLAGYVAGVLLVAFAAADGTDTPTHLIGGGTVTPRFRDATSTDWAAGTTNTGTTTWVGQDALFNPTVGGAVFKFAAWGTESISFISPLGYDTLNNGGSIVCALSGNSASGAIAMTGSLSAVIYAYSPLTDPTGTNNRLFFNDSPQPTQPSSDPGSATNTLSTAPQGGASNVTEFGFILACGVRGHNDTSTPPNSIFQTAATPSITDSGGLWSQIEAHANGPGWSCIGLTTPEPPNTTESVTWSSSLPYLVTFAWHDGVYARKVVLASGRSYGTIIG